MPDKVETPNRPDLLRVSEQMAEALRTIVNEFQGIDSDDLSKAEKNIVKHSLAALAEWEKLNGGKK